MERPATRVLAVLELLQTHGRLPGSELARRIGVDGRTLRRYVVALEQIGVPIVAERGRYGGYALVAGFKLPPMMFTDDEALALSVGLLAARNLGLADAAPAVASAQAKLERVMPTTLKRRVRAIDETVALDLAPGTAASGSNATLMTLSGAAQSRQRVRLHYRTAQRGATERDLDPYGLAWRGGRWYVVGHCHLRGDVRSFRLDRIEDVRPLPKSFGRPERFDTLAHLAFSLASLPRSHAVEVRLSADLATVKDALFEAIGLFEPDGDGVLLFAQVDDLDWFARELARLPFDFEIRGPAALRRALRAQAGRLRRIAGR
ncbi:helix-turn-helix transcriptional regulator [Luteimonas aquatica]|uniref:helix-turn-helix transcriptional regulator n=1 Tax=Luteimonas aquatica TaxID=450364 RepID=UPI001F55B42E|nr:YafY family protein [Luteimonas aquatica]